MKRVLCIIFASLMVLSFLVSCSNNNETKSDTESVINTVATTKEFVETKQSETIVETTTKIEETTMEQANPEELDELFYIQDPIKQHYGEYLDIVFNDSISDISVDVNKGFGTSETYTIKIIMEKGYLFSGYSYDKLLYNDLVPKDPITKDLECTITLNEEKTIFCNYAMTITYHGNGGLICGGETFTEEYDISAYKCPNTKPNQDNISRDGYVLIGYNTKEDMSGDRIGVGSKYYYGTSKANLYCMWAKESDISNFEYTKIGNGCAINKYIGEEEIVVVPEMIDGNRVTSISSKAFMNSTIRQVILPTKIAQVGNRAFGNCKNLEKITCYDAIMKFESDAISACDNFRTLEINSVYTMYHWWGTGTYIKYDRLLWAKDMKKIVILGGSGSWYGWDCEYLNEKLGDEYVIINLGTNASMTNLVIMEILPYYMNEGDILLWSPECSARALGDNTLTSVVDINSEREFSFMAYNYDNIALIDASHFGTYFVSNFAAYNQLHSQKLASFNYSLQSTNIYGDEISIRKTEGKTYSYGYKSALNNPNKFTHMANTILKLQEQGVKTLYTFPVSQLGGEGCKDDDVLDKYQSDMENIFHVTSISDYHNLLFDYKLFHNSAWHLINEGAHKRTLIVYEDLVEYLKKVE